MDYHLLRNKQSGIFILLIIFALVAMSFININKGVTSPKEDIVAISERLRINEVQMKSLENYKNILLNRYDKKDNMLSFYSNQVSKNLISLYKLATSPVKLLFSNEHSLKNTVISYSLFNYYTKFLQNEISETIEHIDLINENTKQVKEIENQIVRNNKEIKNNMKLIEEYIDTSSDNQEQYQQIQKNTTFIIEKSKDISEVISLIDKNHYLQSEIKVNDEIFSKKGNFVWPNAGFIEDYFQKSDNKLYQQGIVIITLPNTQIVSPMQGQVVFVNKFKSFNQTIIIKHSQRVFSIISGKIKPVVKTLQLVNTHEPIAISHDVISSIYFEIREDNKPTNPISWLQPYENINKKST